MIPVYFPFTYLSRRTASALQVCFKRIAVFQPSIRTPPPDMKQMAHEGVIDLRTPIEKDEDRLESACAGYRDWGKRHQENGLMFYKAWPSTFPFFDDSSTQNIRADIQRFEHTEPEKESLEMNARIFLQIAQEFDQQQDELIEAFQSINTREQDLLSELKGEKDHSLDEKFKPRPSDMKRSGEYMAGERINAWITLLKHDKSPSGFFITIDQTVWDRVMAVAPDAQLIFDSHPVPVSKSVVSKWSQDFSEYIITILHNPWPLLDWEAPSIPTARDDTSHIILTLAVIPELSPDHFFFKRLSQSSPQNEKNHHTSRLKNTLIGLARFP